MRKGKNESEKGLTCLAMDHCSETRFIEIMENICAQTASEVIEKAYRSNT